MRSPPLAAAPRPESPRLRAVVDLYYGTVLAAYLHRYSWEIRRRERVAAVSEEVDLESWTAEQIYAEAQRAFLAAWRDRAAWGEASLGELAPYFEQNDFPPRIRGIPPRSATRHRPPRPSVPPEPGSPR